MKKREKILSNIGKIPSLPPMVHKVLQILENPDFDIDELTNTIEYDPGLTSNILRLANSAFFGCQRSITSVKNAFVRLGANNVFHLIVTSAYAPLAQKAIKGYNLHPGEFWEHSVAVSIGTDKIAKALNIKPPDYTFTAGLLHDIGKIVLESFVEVDASSIIDFALKENTTFDIAEREIFGIDHAEVGAAFLEYWNLPPTIVEVVRWHHQPEDYPNKTIVIDLTHIADGLVLMSGIGAGLDGLNYRISKEVVSRLQFNNRIAEAVVSEIITELDELRELFHLGVRR